MKADSLRATPGVWVQALPPLVASQLLLVAFVARAEHLYAGLLGLAAYAAICWTKPVVALILALIAMPLAPKIELPLGNLYIATVLVMVFAGTSLVKRIADPRPLRVSRNPLARPLLFFAAVLTLSTTMNMAFLLSNREQLLRFVQFLFYLSLFFIASDMSMTRAQRRWVLVTVIATGVVEGGIATAQWLTRTGFFTTGTFDNQHNHLAAYLVLTGLVLLGVLLESGRSRVHVLLTACYALMMFGLVFSFSRTGYIGIATGMALFAFLRVSWKKRFFVLALLALGAGLAFIFVPSSVAERFGTIAVVAAGKTQKDISFTVRLEMWEEAIEAFKRSPILGTGAMSFELRDNYFMKMLGESGLVGVFALAWVILAVLRALRGAIRIPEGDRLVRGAKLGMMPAAFVILVVFNSSGDFMNLHRLMGAFWVLLAVVMREFGPEPSGGPPPPA